MDIFNLNKVATSFLVAALIIMVISNVAELIYPNKISITEENSKNFEEIIPVSGGDKISQSSDVNLMSLLAVADITKGQVVSKKCVSCHTFDKGGPNKIGPNLWGIVGNNKAHLGKSFNYSKALLGKGGAWTVEDLFLYLQKPQSYIKGTRMAFAGIKNQQEIANLIAFLNSKSDKPMFFKKDNPTSP